jgi:hypothetical protein
MAVASQKEMVMAQRIFQLSAGVLALVVVGCGRKDEPAKVTVQPDVRLVGGETGEDIGKRKADFTFTADEWVKEHDNDGVTEKYQDKVVELRGEIDTVALTGGKVPTIILKAGTALVGAVCLLADKDPWGKVAPGQTVKLRGKVAAAPWTLTECVLVELGPNPAMVLSSADFAKEYLADEAKASDKYYQKAVIVAGEMLNKKEIDNGRISVLLKGDGKSHVNCVFGSTEKSLADQCAKGHQLKILGVFNGLLSSDQGPGLFGCILIEAK